MHRRDVSIYHRGEGSRSLRNSAFARLYPLFNKCPYVAGQEGPFAESSCRETLWKRFTSCRILQKGRQLFRKWKNQAHQRQQVERDCRPRRARSNGSNQRRLSCHIHITSREVGSPECCHPRPSRRLSPRPLRVVVWANRYGEIPSDLDEISRTFRQANQ
nr:MAG: hypothetical protein [Chemarfal virus 53]